MPRDKRPYITDPRGLMRNLRLSDFFPMHPRVEGLSDAAFALYVKLLAGSRGGRIDRRPARATKAAYRELDREGLIDQDGWITPIDDLFRGPFGEDRFRPHIPLKIRRYVYERDGFACVTCGTFDGISLDHIIPWSLGGPDTIENLQTMCRPCNSRKGAR